MCMSNMQVNFKYFTIFKINNSLTPTIIFQPTIYITILQTYIHTYINMEDSGFYKQQQFEPHFSKFEINKLTTTFGHKQIRKVDVFCIALFMFYFIIPYSIQEYLQEKYIVRQQILDLRFRAQKLFDDRDLDLEKKFPKQFAQAIISDPNCTCKDKLKNVRTIEIGVLSIPNFLEFKALKILTKFTNRSQIQKCSQIQVRTQIGKKPKTRRKF
eukprot:TRINITY_DN8337_c2_g1_i1.p3 TRINITY_DN8337_c2_g1~~TRINITY_DN8337_c2_g1_i1.p3  ORF type:complete len:213 (+),score=3.43 TRINITY_DN8337_c2_g1_i1:279-917(+)